MALLAGSMGAQLVSAGFEWFYALRIVAAAAVLWWFLPTYRTWDWRVGPGAIGLGVGAFVVWTGLERVIAPVAHVGTPPSLMGATATLKTAWIALRVFGAVVTAPVAEELAFRGFLLRRLESEDFHGVAPGAVSWIAILLSSAAFGVLHGDRWIAGTIAGAVYAVAYLRRGSIGDAVAAHATTNALISAAVLLAGQWQLW
jgi:CAAX prenyl protease-like protein